MPKLPKGFVSNTSDTSLCSDYGGPRGMKDSFMSNHKRAQPPSFDNDQDVYDI